MRLSTYGGSAGQMRRLVPAALLFTLMPAFSAGYGGTVTTTYSYDALGRLTGATATGAVSNTSGYTYDKAGNRTGQTLSGGTGNPTVSGPASIAATWVTIFGTAEELGCVDVSAYVTDPHSYPLTISGITQGHVSGSTVVITSGTFVCYISPTDGSWTDSFTYTVSNGYGGTATGTVNVTVTR